MKKLIFAIIGFALVFAGYSAEVGTGSVARDSSGGSYARAVNAGPWMGIPRSSDQHQEESSASDAQILVISTLIALALANCRQRSITAERLRGISQLSQPGTVTPDRLHTDIRHRQPIKFGRSAETLLSAS